MPECPSQEKKNEDQGLIKSTPNLVFEYVLFQRKRRSEFPDLNNDLNSPNTRKEILIIAENYKAWGLLELVYRNFFVTSESLVLKAPD